MLLGYEIGLWAKFTLRVTAPLRRSSLSPEETRDGNRQSDWHSSVAGGAAPELRPQALSARPTPCPKYNLWKPPAAGNQDNRTHKRIASQWCSSVVIGGRPGIRPHVFAQKSLRFNAPIFVYNSRIMERYYDASLFQP